MLMNQFDLLNKISNQIKRLEDDKNKAELSLGYMEYTLEKAREAKLYLAYQKHSPYSSRRLIDSTLVNKIMTCELPILIEAKKEEISTIDAKIFNIKKQWG